MKCLLFGATGFLGGHIRSLLDAHPGVTVVAAGRSPRPGHLRLDLAATGPADVLRIVRTVAPDVVVNAAGVTGGGAEAMAAGNVVAVANLIAALDRHDRPVRLVHLGSAAEYGPVPAGRPVPEDRPAEPLTAYGMSKLAGTELVLAARRRGREATVLRVFNPVGPGTPDRLLPGRLVGELLRAARTGERARVGNLDGHRDFVDVRDVAAAVVAAATTGASPALINVGSGEATALRDFAALAAGLAGVEVPAEDETVGSARSAVVTWQQADIDVAGSALGWQPRIPLAVSLTDMGLGATRHEPASR